MRSPLSNLLLGALVPLVLTAAACSKPKDHEATVVLKVDGKSYDYSTRVAHVETRSDPGTYSVYLLPSKGAAEAQSQPHVSLRTYSGNPVPRLSLHYLAPGADMVLRYECFVPGKLPDGRSTLGWKRANGDPRDRTQTGQADCKAKVVREGEALRFTFAATLRPAIKRGGKGKKAKEAHDALAKTVGAVKISGSATIKL
jgi:hypothetical protein